MKSNVSKADEMYLLVHSATAGVRGRCSGAASAPARYRSRIRNGVWFVVRVCTMERS